MYSTVESHLQELGSVQASTKTYRVLLSQIPLKK